MKGRNVNFLGSVKGVIRKIFNIEDNYISDRSYGMNVNFICNGEGL
jgi:hypothetical protein